MPWAHAHLLDRAFSPDFSLDEIWDADDGDVFDFCAWLDTPEAQHAIAEFAPANPGRAAWLRTLIRCLVPHYRVRPAFYTRESGPLCPCPCDDRLNELPRASPSDQDIPRDESGREHPPVTRLPHTLAAIEALNAAHSSRGALWSPESPAMQVAREPTQPVLHVRFLAERPNDPRIDDELIVTHDQSLRPPALVHHSLCSAEFIGSLAARARAEAKSECRGQGRFGRRARNVPSNLTDRAAVVPIEPGPPATNSLLNRAHSFDNCSLQVLFIGSSSIRMWKTLAADMAPVPVLNRGFGGSKTGEVLAVFDRIVAPYNPSIIVYYCGDNDLGTDNSDSQAAAEGFIEFDKRARRHWPDVSTFYIAIKPSVARWKNWPAMDRANGLVRGYCSETPGAAFLDIATPMRTAEGTPDPAIFEKDGLHLNAAGYAIWTGIVGPAVQRAWNETNASPR